MGDFFVLYNGSEIRIGPHQLVLNLRRDWLPVILPTSLVFNLWALPASFGAASNATVTIRTNNSNLPITLPRQSASSIRTNGFSMTFLLETGSNYVIQTSTNLNNWAALTNFVCNCATNPFRDVTATNKSKSFYRAVSQ